MWFSKAWREQPGFWPQRLSVLAEIRIAASSKSLLLVMQSSLSMAKAKFE